MVDKLEKALGISTGKRRCHCHARGVVLGKTGRKIKRFHDKDCRYYRKWSHLKASSHRR